MEKVVVNGKNFVMLTVLNYATHFTVPNVHTSYILQNVREVWNQWEFYLLFTLYALYVHPDTTHFLSRFTIFVQILLNILGSTVAQQSAILCLR
jgi:hypothetical protein